MGRTRKPDPRAAGHFARPNKTWTECARKVASLSPQQVSDDWQFVTCKDCLKYQPKEHQ